MKVAIYFGTFLCTELTLLVPLLELNVLLNTMLFMTTSDAYALKDVSSMDLHK